MGDMKMSGDVDRDFAKLMIPHHQGAIDMAKIEIEHGENEELKTMARLMASKPNDQLFGQTEFELRDRVHELGARVLETAADERQKKGRVRGS